MDEIQNMQIPKHTYKHLPLISNIVVGANLPEKFFYTKAALTTILLSWNS